MDKQERGTYARGARVVVPVFVLALVYMGFRVWLVSRSHWGAPVIDFDAMMEQVVRESAQQMVDECEEAGWEGGFCENLLSTAKDRPADAGAVRD
jgi:hypothetical protein